MPGHGAGGPGRRPAEGVRAENMQGAHVVRSRRAVCEGGSTGSAW